MKKLRPNLQNVSLIALLVVFTGIACSSFTKGKAAGEKAVEKFHVQMNEEKYEEIYDQAAKEFQNSDSKENAIKFLQAVRRKLGTVNKASERGFHVNTTPFNTIVNLDYEAEFSNDTADESFTFIINGDEAQLAGYHVNSKKLITE